MTTLTALEAFKGENYTAKTLLGEDGKTKARREYKS